MSLARLPILALLYFFSFHHLTFTVNLRTPYFPFEDFLVNKLVCVYNNFVSVKPLPLRYASSSSTPGLHKAVHSIATGLIIFMTLLNVIVYYLRRFQESNFGERDKHVSLFSEHPCRLFSLCEIKSATDNFKDELVIGKGGFGKVYKGIIDNGARTVAMKRLEPMSHQGAPEFWTEIEMLSKFRHSHLLSLIGYCNEGSEMILVYEYIPHGTLADHLHKTRRYGCCPLSWVQRLNLCIGAARGLEYLHTGTSLKHGVIHRDVKSSNILLDKNWEAKISDFGLSKIGPIKQACTHVSTNVKGTFGYIDPNYFLTRRLTRKSDVYAFGVLLFEVLCGRQAVDLRLDEEQQGLAGWAQHCFKEGIIDQIIDPSLRGQILSECLMAFGRIANQCLNNHPKGRPTMAEVIVSLEVALALQESSSASIMEAGTKSLKPFRMTLTKKLRMFLSGADRAISVFSDAKFTKNKKKNKKNCMSSLMLKTKVPRTMQTVTPNLKIFTFAALKSATRNFRSDMFLGHSGLSMVFKGWVDENMLGWPSDVGPGMPVAVKRYNPESFQGFKGWQLEMEFLGNSSHPNLVKLLGYCLEGDEPLLVYEYLLNGSLDTHLFRKNRKSLPWVTRLKIAIGAARGLAFMHTKENRVIHHSFEALDILLDRELNAKLTDLVLFRLGPVNLMKHIETRVMDSMGYAAPEYVTTGHLSVKSDVYGFGVVLLEMLTGLRVADLTRSNGYRNLVDWAKPFLTNKRKLNTLVDPELKEDYPPEGAVLSAVSALILKCVDFLPRNRPSMVEILDALEEINASRSRLNQGET